MWDGVYQWIVFYFFIFSEDGCFNENGPSPKLQGLKKEKCKFWSPPSLGAKQAQIQKPKLLEQEPANSINVAVSVLIYRLHSLL